MQIINVADGIDVITGEYIPLASHSIRETVNGIIAQERLYTANRRRIRTERNRKNNLSLTKRLATVICSL